MKKLIVAVIMDDIAKISVKKDSTLAMMLEAQKRNYTIVTLDTNDLFFQNDSVMASVCETRVFDEEKKWFEKQPSKTIDLSDVDVVLMRKDPPFDMNYIYATYFLEMLEKKGVVIVNSAKALRDFNEKLSILAYPDCIPETLVSANIDEIKAFIQKIGKVVVKPLDGMGGKDIFLFNKDDVNQSVALEHLTKSNNTPIMAQKFLSEIAQGDKRILIINGKPIDYALLRKPKEGEFRGNLMAGGQGFGVKLTDRDYFLCEQIAPTLKANGLYFVGLDVIGDYITEINITSPTCIRELDNEYGLNIAGELFDVIETAIKKT
jgi:glutathione synthase